MGRPLGRSLPLAGLVGHAERAEQKPAGGPASAQGAAPQNPGPVLGLDLASSRIA